MSKGGSGGGIFPWFGGRKASGGDRPNIIMVVLDQFRNDMRKVHGVFGDLKKRGVLFSQVVTHAPYTIASMHATFTGLYGRDTGVDGYTRSSNYHSESCYTIVQYLKDLGYWTRGYSFSPILFPHESFEVLKIVPEGEEPGILDSHLKEIQEAFAGRRPFFQFLHYGEIHHHVLREVLRKYDPFDAEYFGNIERNRQRYAEYAKDAGAYMEELLKVIDAKDPDGESLLVVMTDHGGGIGEKVGEKAYGVYTYDYTVCVWAYLICPKRLPVDREIRVQVRTVDILPTILDLLGGGISKKHKPPRGRSLMPVIRGEETEDRLAFCETGGVEGPNPSPDSANVKSVRDGRWKLIYNTTTSQMELYDLEKDPNEQTNLYAVHQEKARELWGKLSAYL